MFFFGRLLAFCVLNWFGCLCLMDDGLVMLVTWLESVACI